MKAQVSPAPNQEILSNLKFSECLSPSIAREVFAARFNDAEAIANLRREQMRVVIEG